MKDARFTIPTPGLLAKVVDMLDAVPMDDRDTKGDLYEYMLGKIATAGKNGQFRTPRHIIKMMVELTAPKPSDIICDPAYGTAGFLVAAAEHLRERHSEIFTDVKAMRRFNHETFNGFDFDSTMLRIGSMNMLLLGIENPDIQNRDSLSEDHAGIEEQYTLILANPPFAGSLVYVNFYTTPLFRLTHNIANQSHGIPLTHKYPPYFLLCFSIVSKQSRGFLRRLEEPCGFISNCSNLYHSQTASFLLLIVIAMQMPHPRLYKQLH